MQKHIGLFFGSFNPVHVGHMILANHMVTHTDLNEVWMVVSPHNPFKDKKSLAPDYDRLHMVHLAIGDNMKLRASDIEFGLPQPSYSIDTLAYLHEKYPKYKFSLIMGGDNLPTIHKWKNGDLLLERYKIYVYNRPGYTIDKLYPEANITIVDAPLLEISSTFIRGLIAEKKSIQYLVTDKVADYIDSTGLYLRKKRSSE